MSEQTTQGQTVPLEPDVGPVVEHFLQTLAWYAGHAEKMRDYTLSGNSKAMLYVMRALALDGGDRAKKLLTPNARVNRQAAPATEDGNGN